MYASSLSLLEGHGLYLEYPAIRTFATIGLLPPYLIGEFKNSMTKKMEAQQPLALAAAMLLLERVKLRRLSKNSSLDDLRVYTFTCCGTLITFYYMTIPPANNEAGELLSYEMRLCRSYSLIDRKEIIELTQTPNRIHSYGQTAPLQGIMSDIEAIKERISIEDIDKHTYEYKGGNTFEQGDELLIMDQGDMANGTEAASVDSAIASELEPGASASVANDYTSPKKPSLLATATSEGMPVTTTIRTRGGALLRPSDSNISKPSQLRASQMRPAP